jgi:hypothetical protein
VALDTNTYMVLAPMILSHKYYCLVGNIVLCISLIHWYTLLVTRTNNVWSYNATNRRGIQVILLDLDFWTLVLLNVVEVVNLSFDTILYISFIALP